MAISAQDKILYVANKLGLSTLKNMQATTGWIYDTWLTNVDNPNTFEAFKSCSQKYWPLTNVTDNTFQVNEALLIESISITGIQTTDESGVPAYQAGSSQTDLDFWVYDIVVGNKTIVKQQKLRRNAPFVPSGMGRHACGHYMEGVGLLIPPQVEFQVNVSYYNGLTMEPKSLSDLFSKPTICLYGTQVLLDFNTSL